MVGTSDTSPPFSSRENGKVVGYAVDLAALVAKRLALPMETISVVNADRIPALQQDRVDLVASGITRAENRRKDVGFSLAYLVSPHKVLIRRDGGIATVGQMAGRKLALVKTASVDAELKAAVPTMQIVFFEDYAACFRALAESDFAKAGALAALCRQLLSQLADPLVMRMNLDKLDRAIAERQHPASP